MHVAYMNFFSGLLLHVFCTFKAAPCGMLILDVKYSCSKKNSGGYNGPPDFCFFIIANAAHFCVSCLHLSWLVSKHRLTLSIR